MDIYEYKKCIYSSKIFKYIYIRILAQGCFGLRAVKLKISWEEWDYCFPFSFVKVLDFVKDVWNVKILNLETESEMWKSGTWKQKV